MAMMRKIAEIGVISNCILFLTAWTWWLSIWMRHGVAHPVLVLETMLRDLEYIGPYAFIFDVLFLSATSYWLLMWRSKGLDRATTNE